MADEVARMMADLGTERRELISTPLATNSGRPLHDDPNEERAIAAQAEARRAAVLKQVHGGDVNNAHAAKIRAWHSEDTFENDELTGQLENRYSGQGHRAALSNKYYDAQNEHVQNRYGEERALYLQQRATSGGSNYTASRPPCTGQGNFSPQHHRQQDATPRSCTNTTPGDTNIMKRSRAAPSGPLNPNRAQSPRSFGTVRIAGGQLTVNHLPLSGSARAVNRPPSTAIPSTTPSAPAAIRPAAEKSPCSASKISNFSAAFGVSQFAQASPLTAPDASIVRAPAGLRPDPTVYSPPPTVPDWKSVTDDVYYTHLCFLAVVQAARDEPTFQIIKKDALRNASRIGAEKEDFYARHPGRLNQLRIAKMYLIATAIRLADKPEDNILVVGFLGRGPDREWMLDAARESIKHAQHPSDEVDVYYNVHPEHREFLAAAKAAVGETKVRSPTATSSQLDTRGDCGEVIRLWRAATAQDGSFATSLPTAPAFTSPVTAASGDMPRRNVTGAPARTTTTAPHLSSTTATAATDRRSSVAQSAGISSAAATLVVSCSATAYPAAPLSAALPSGTASSSAASLAGKPLDVEPIAAAPSTTESSAVEPSATTSSAIAPSATTSSVSVLSSFIHASAARHAVTPAVPASTVAPPATTIEPSRTPSTPHLIPSSFPTTAPTMTPDHHTNDTTTHNHPIPPNPSPTTHGIHITRTITQTTSPANPTSPSSSISTSIPANTVARHGTLTASVFNYLGKLLDIKQVGVDAPVHMKVDITATQAGYDPRRLIRELEELGRRMGEASECGGLEGFREGWDGVWNEVV